MIAKYLKQHRISQSEIARQLDIAPNGVGVYLQQASLQMGIIWKIGIAANHNFLAEIAEQHPVKTPTHRETELQEELSVSASRIRDLENELEIYKRIVGK